MSEVDVTTIESEMVSSSAADDPIIVVKSVAVEEDLKDLLPSVKNLAIAFTSENRSHEGSANEKMDVTADDNTSVEMICQPAAESYVPPYNQTYHPAEPNPNVTIQNGSIASIASTNGKGDVVVRERSKSPIPAASNLRSSIAFFENLKK